MSLFLSHFTNEAERFSSLPRDAQLLGGPDRASQPQTQFPKQPQPLWASPHHLALLPMPSASSAPPQPGLTLLTLALAPQGAVCVGWVDAGWVNMLRHRTPGCNGQEKWRELGTSQCKIELDVKIHDGLLENTTRVRFCCFFFSLFCIKINWT